MLRAEKNEKFDKAVKLMNKYTETIALPFITTKKQSALTKRLEAWFADDETPEPAKYLRKWKTGYEKWLKHTKATPKQKQVEEFAQLKTTFFTLYTLSFSGRNFPPVAR